jgi:hypothetical protein
MSVIQGIQNIVRFTGVSQAGGSAAGQSSYATLTPEAHSDFLRARTELLNLYRAIEKLAELSNINTRFKLDLPDARSTSPLGLDLTETAAFLNSSNEINASPTSFTPFGPDWLDGSTSLITIGGEYDGLTPTSTLTFESACPQLHGKRGGSAEHTVRPAKRTLFHAGRGKPDKPRYNIHSGVRQRWLVGGP